MSEQDFSTLSSLGSNMANANVIPVIFVSDENYAKYLGVTLFSMLENASKDRQYHIHIFDCGMKENTLRLLKKQCAHLIQTKQIELHIHDAREVIRQHQDKLYTRLYFTQAVYIRLFISDILTQYDKLMYLDCDLIIQGDISALFHADTKDAVLAGVTDQGMAYHREHTPDYALYCEQKLGLNKLHTYINSGVLVINAALWREQQCTSECLSVLEKLREPLYPDQDVVNVVFKGKIHYLPTSWNVTRDGDPDPNVQPEIIHYTGELKPWNTPSSLWSEDWWFYARKTLFYETIVYDNTKQITRQLIREKSLGGKFKRWLGRKK